MDDLRVIVVTCVLALLIGCVQVPVLEFTDERPNVLLIVIDDLGYTDLGSYGGEIRTPNLDALADQGLRFTNFYVSPNCGPTRSMLLSGMDHHLSGNGTMVEHIGTNQRGVPGYEGYLSDQVATLPEVLKNAGYRTYMAGKWHLGRSEERSPAARGFDKSFALLLGGASHFSDKLGLVSMVSDAPYREDGKLVETLPDEFYSTDFYTDKTIEYIEDGRRKSDQPFFAYLAYTAVHWPLQIPDSAMDMYQGSYDDGYGLLRQQRLKNAVRKGVVSPDVPLGQGNARVTDWQNLSEDEKKIQSRRMEIYASMLNLVDQNIGRLLAHLDEIGELENTVIYVMSDNGAEGNGRFRLGGDDWIEKNFDHSYEAMGKAGSYVFTGPGWAEASSVPFRLWKAHTTEGGIRAPLIVAGPGVDQRTGVTDAISTVRDIMPTILDVTATDFPSGEFEGRTVLPMSGRSQLQLISGAAAAVHEESVAFGFEIFGGRAIRQGDWKLLLVAGPNGSSEWQLYNLAVDPGETEELASSEPEKFEELKALWRSYQQENNVILPEGDLKQPWGDED